MEIGESPVIEERQMFHLSLKKAKTMIRGITSQSTSLWFPGGWDEKYGANPLVRHFWAHKENVIGNSQH